jgi:hypothetical protein
VAAMLDRQDARDIGRCDLHKPDRRGRMELTGIVVELNLQ